VYPVVRSCRQGARNGWWVLGAGCLAAVLAGCAHEPRFPAAVAVHGVGRERVHAFDLNGDRRPDYWQYERADGRKGELAYADGTGEPGPRVALDAQAGAACPHVLLVLDGVPFELVKQLYDEGRFRLFRPPTRVLCCFPSMTDLALADLFHAPACPGFQALYYNRATGAVSDGNREYLAGRSAPWVAAMTYRVSTAWDVLVYLDPLAVFQHEMDQLAKLTRDLRAGELRAYSLGSAGLGIREGRAGIVQFLEAVDRLCEQIVYEHHGRVKISLTADHGHNLVRNERVDFEPLLRASGYRPATALHDPRDVVEIRYGLVTYADFATQDPAGVGACLLKSEAVEFACYRDGDAVLVVDRDGQARITSGPHGLRYDSSSGDPLRLTPIIARLKAAGKVSAEGDLDGEAFFAATVDHEYPDPLARLWRAFHGMVANPPDVIANLRDGYCHGSKFFHVMAYPIRSTHGSLNRANSETFVLTMLGDLPPVLRTEEVLPRLEALRGVSTAAQSQRAP
jgi:hypothetical protein